MNLLLLIPWLIGGYLLYLTALFIARALDLFFKLLGVFMGLWLLTGFVGFFQHPRITGEIFKTFGITYSLGFLVVFWILSFIRKWSESEGSYQERFDDLEVLGGEETVVYVEGELVFEGDFPQLQSPPWKNPYDQVGRMGFGGTVGGWEKVPCQQCGTATEQRRAGKNTYVCYDCANINYYE